MPERDVSTMVDIMEVIDEMAGGISELTIELIRIREALEWIVNNCNVDQWRPDLNGPILGIARAPTSSPEADTPKRNPPAEPQPATAPPLTTETPERVFFIEGPRPRSGPKLYLAHFEGSSPQWTAELGGAMLFRSYCEAAAILRERRDHLKRATVGIA